MFDDLAVSAAMRTYVLETAPVLALYLDADQRVAGANAQARRVLRPEAPGRPLAEQIIDFTHSLDLAALIRQAGVVHRLSISTAADLPETFDFRFFPLPVGTLVLASLDLAEQETLRDEVLGLNRELNDLTRQLHQANAELRELNHLKNQFLGMAAHDLRKPIGVIMTYSEFVLDEAAAQLSVQHQDFLRTCLQAADGMKQLIDGFLDLSVIESGQLRLDRAAASAAEILAGVAPMARLMAGKKRITLELQPADDARQIRVDAPKLQQVLLNLVGNAVEHSVPGQRVWLSARWESSALVFAVRDEGPGLAPEEQARLFTAFGRGTAKKTAGERSTGLGLTISRLIVEAHGGRIWVVSTPGHGATFLFTLPIPSP